MSRRSSTSSKASSQSQKGQKENPLAILKLESIASELSANSNNPELVKQKAEELRLIAKQAFAVLAFIGVHAEEFEAQIAVMAETA